MYLPSMLFGGSSLIHLLASNPRVVALFGLGALMTTLLQSPFGTPDVAGTAGYVAHLEQVVRVQGSVDPAVIDRARNAARALAQSPNSRLTAIVEETLRACGIGCITVHTSAVLKNQTMLNDVLLLHALNDANVRSAAAPVKAAAKTTELQQ
jgi:hypothetical protein